MSIVFLVFGGVVEPDIIITFSAIPRHSLLLQFLFTIFDLHSRSLELVSLQPGKHSDHLEYISALLTNITEQATILERLRFLVILTVVHRHYSWFGIPRNSWHV